MRAHRRGIALILVIIAIAGAFAFAMQAAMVARASQSEVRVMVERLRDERDARAAAVAVLVGIASTLPNNQNAIATNAPETPQSGSEPETDLPEIVRALLRDSGKLDEVEAGAQQLSEQAAEAQERLRANAGAGDAIQSPIGFSRLAETGLPPNPIPVNIQGKTYNVRVRDALGGLNINNAPRDHILEYLRLKQINDARAQAIADQVIDWRDADDIPQPRGAERTQYNTQDIEPRNAELRAPEELLYLPDMDRPTYDLIRDDITLTGEQIHAGTAAEPVIRSIPGINQGLADEIIELRERGELTPDTLGRLIPPANRELEQRLRADSSNFLELTITRSQPPGPVYRGLAVLGRNRIVALGLKLD